MPQLSEALTIVGLSHPGMVRDHNEDAYLVDPALGIVILADGMGGYSAGEVASNMTTTLMLQGLQQGLTQHPLNEFKHEKNEAVAFGLLKQELAHANKSVLHASRTEPHCAGMGTTVVSALFYDDTITVAHIGDSRLYRLRQGQLATITRDHSLLQEQLDAGLITAEEARFSTNRNLVTRALGLDDDVEPDINHHLVEVGDVYLLCSDGLNDMMDDSEIESTLVSLIDNLPMAAEHLVQTANDNGGRDNVTVILVKVNQSFALPRSIFHRLRQYLFR